MARWSEYERRARQDRDPRRDTDDRDAWREGNDWSPPRDPDRGYGAWDPQQYGYGTGAGPDVRRRGAEYRRRDAHGREYRGEPRGWSADDQDWGPATAERRPDYLPSLGGHGPRYDAPVGERGDRGLWDRSRDRVAAWFGDDDAERRIREDHRGRGPKGYTRSDERIREDVCERLTEDSFVDASDVEIAVANGEVTLTGTVASREARRRAEDCVEAATGVHHVQNDLRVKRPGMGAMLDAGGGGVTAGIVPTAGTSVPSGATPRDGGRH